MNKPRPGKTFRSFRIYPKDDPKTHRPAREVDNVGTAEYIDDRVREEHDHDPDQERMAELEFQLQKPNNRQDVRPHSCNRFRPLEWYAGEGRDLSEDDNECGSTKCNRNRHKKNPYFEATRQRRREDDVTGVHANNLPC